MVSCGNLKVILFLVYCGHVSPCFWFLRERQSFHQSKRNNVEAILDSLLSTKSSWFYIVLKNNISEGATFTSHVLFFIFWVLTATFLKVSQHHINNLILKFSTWWMTSSPMTYENKPSLYCVISRVSTATPVGWLLRILMRTHPRNWDLDDWVTAWKAISSAEVFVYALAFS